MSPSLSPSYEAVTRSGVVAFAWGSASAWLIRILRNDETLAMWARSHAVGVRAGRGPVHVVEAPVGGPDARSHWAVRHYRRGGVAAPLLGDRYWAAGRTRPEGELEASLRARACGVRTPAVMAGAAYRAGSSGMPGFYRADLATELVPDARRLFDVVREVQADATVALRRAGRLVRALERAQLMHPDLNAGNLVLDDVGEAWVIDLDRARCLRHPSPRAGVAMLRRLERSLRKLGSSLGRSITPEEWGALRAGFAEGP